MTTFTHEVNLNEVLMEAFMPAYGLKAMELGNAEGAKQRAACVACAWPLVYKMTQASVFEQPLDINQIEEFIWSFTQRNEMHDLIISVEQVLDINTQIGVWSVVDGILHLEEDMIQISRKKKSMIAREVGTEERTARDIAKIGDWEKRSLSINKTGEDKKLGMLPKAIAYLEAQQFTINKDIAYAFCVEGIEPQVIEQCKLDVKKTLIQQCDADSRGRIYYQAYNAPHPAADDARVALYKMVTDTKIQIGSSAHAAYLAELADIDDVDHKWKAVAMKLDIANADADGWYIPSQPVGLDAKSSGAQIYSILMGDAELGAMCGLTTEYTPDQKINDPYSVTARILSSKLKGI